jgi:hypothetical protein
MQAASSPRGILQTECSEGIGMPKIPTIVGPRSTSLDDSREHAVSKHLYSRLGTSGEFSTKYDPKPALYEDLRPLCCYLRHLSIEESVANHSSCQIEASKRADPEYGVENILVDTALLVLPCLQSFESIEHGTFVSRWHCFLRSFREDHGNIRTAVLSQVHR